MFWRKSEKTDKSVKNLSEKDIQRQLYGNYLEKVEVMDSSFIVKEKEEAPVEKLDVKTKREVTTELEGLKGELKRLQGEVNRLKKDKESLERSDVWFKPPFLRARQLVIIGSLVVLIAIASASFFTIKFFVSKIGRKAPAAISSSSAPSSTKKEIPPKASTKKTDKKTKRKER